MPLLTRSVCALGRAVDTVYVLRTPEIPADYPAELESELDRRSQRPRVVWLEPGGALPMAAGLFVVCLPGVFDHKLCRDLLSLPDSDAKIIRCRQPWKQDSVLWFVGKERCAEVARFLAQRPEAVGDFLLSEATDEHVPRERICEVILDERDRLAVEAALFAGTRKPTDTWIARHFDRYVSNWITRRLLPTGATPNQVSVASFVLGIVGALLILAGSHLLTIAGTALLVLCIIVDGCDGEIARLKFMDSPSGRKLDFMLDNVVNALALFTIGFGYYLQSGERFFLYAPAFNAAAALTCAVPVYLLFYRQDVEPAANEPKTTGARLTEAVMGRDFMYGLFFLALINRVHWFVYLTLGGILFFLASVVILLIKRRLEGTGRAMGKAAEVLRASQAAGDAAIPYSPPEHGVRARSAAAPGYPPRK
jgi:phosphatidylglycerophosphate synthase